MIVGTARHDDTLTNASAAVFFGILITGFEMHDRGYPKPRFEDRIVYIRP